MALNLQGLIDDVLDLARRKQTPGRFSGGEWIPGAEVDRRRILDADLQKQRLINKGASDVQRLRNLSDINLQEMKGRGELDTQRLRNIGELDVQRERSIGELGAQKERSAGELARQRLANIGAEAVAELGFKGERYRADKMVEAYQGRASDPDKLISEIVKSNAITDPNEIIKLRRKLRMQNELNPPSVDDIRSFYTVPGMD